MKQTILQTFILLLLFTFSSQAQVTITESNFPRLASFTDSVYRVPIAGIALPSEGPDQVWDYSGLGAGEQLYSEHFDASNDTAISNALNYYNSDLSFQGFVIPRNVYENLDSGGWYDTGITTEEVVYSIAAISGGATDSLRFLAQAFNISTPNAYVKFPMTYQSQWTQSASENTNFEISIAAFGLNKTPGVRDRTRTEDREIVGYGTLKIPKTDGTPSAPMEVLLMKVKRVQVDSFFLGGGLAPPALLGAFGLTQGSTVADSFYVFYSPDFGAPILNLNYNEDNHFYRPQAAGVSTAVHELNRISFRSFPNPVSAGQALSIQAKSPVSAGYISLFDLNGRLIQQTVFEASAGQQLLLQIPAKLEGGFYIYQISDEAGNPIGREKLLVR